MQRLDLIIRGGTVATVSDVFAADIGVRDGRIVAIGELDRPADLVIDAAGKLVLPGGIDSHCHMDQQTYEGVETADDFRSGTMSAACGGTTTVIPFAMPLPGQSLPDVVADYRRRAEGNAVLDYGIHLIVTDPSERFLGRDLPNLAMDGYTSLKIYLTYAGFKLEDRQVLRVLDAARRERLLVMVHAENDDCIEWLTEKLLAEGKHAIEHVADAHSIAGEREATHRAITFAEIVRTPILIVHVSSGQAMEQIAWARGHGLAVYGETCPQYLLLNRRHLCTPGIAAAKFVCSPPPRTEADNSEIWKGVKSGLFDVVSSDHSPRRFADARGKMRYGPDAPFHKISAGVPGIELRLPLMFSEGVLKRRISLSQFVALTATNAARLYGLAPRKGSIAIGADADLVLWDPDRPTRIRHDMLHDNTDYTPYEGIEVGGWPMLTLSRGEVVCRDGEFVGTPGRGQFLPRARFAPDAAWQP